jgi:hypothetical protein
MKTELTSQVRRLVSKKDWWKYFAAASASSSVRNPTKPNCRVLPSLQFPITLTVLDPPQNRVHLTKKNCTIVVIIHNVHDRMHAVATNSKQNYTMAQTCTGENCGVFPHSTMLTIWTYLWAFSYTELQNFLSCWSKHEPRHHAVGTLRWACSFNPQQTVNPRKP